MKKDGYYSSGEFAKMAHVTLRTIRFYDKKNLLKPSFVTDKGARFYTREDLKKLQQILLFKYLGFSLDDIKEMIIEATDSEILGNALILQKKLVEDRIEQMQMVADSIDSAIAELSRDDEVDWSQMLDLIHLTSMENSLKKQYQNANNISARIRLHEQFSINRQGWFPWIYEQCEFETGMKVLEVGCGSGQLWIEKQKELPNGVDIILSDISEGMIRDVRRTIGTEDERFSFEVIDAHDIPYDDNTFDLVIANHMLFYCEDIDRVCCEVHRVLKSGGRFVCSTYSSKHMKEIAEVVQEFDNRIVLSGDTLYERFGLDCGKEILEKCFDNINKCIYEDEIVIDRPEPLVEYILSCHGNQNQYLLERYSEFKLFIEKKLKREFHITKDAGIFICIKSI